MPRCTVCGKIYVGSTCPFCEKPKGIDSERHSLDKLGWDDSEKLYFDPEKIEKKKIVVHGTYVQGDIKTIHGDELQRGATKTEVKDSVIQRSQIGDDKKQKLTLCPNCGNTLQEGWVVCPSCGNKT